MTSMTEEKERAGEETYSLEELNNQFNSNIKNKHKKKYKKVLGMMLALLVLLVVITVLIWNGRGGTKSTKGSTQDPAAVEDVGDDKVTSTVESTMNVEETEMYNESILSEEDQEKWAATEPTEDTIFIELKDMIYLDGRQAYIRLVNPIYCTYYYRITICPEGEEGTILYQSEKIAPGTILEAVMLTDEPTEEQYRAVVQYQVYDEEGNELGTHPVSVEFTIDEQYK